MKLNTLSNWFGRLLICGGTSVCSLAIGATVNISGFVFPTAKTVEVPSQLFSAGAGQLQGTVNGNSVFTYLTQVGSISSNVDLSDYELVPGVTAWGASRSEELDKLITAAIAAGVPGNSEQSAAVQAAVWEVLFETDAVRNLAAGTFIATSPDIGTQAFFNSINWSGILASTPTIHVNALVSRTQPDLLIISTINVPETGIPGGMTASLLLGCAWVRSRIRR